MAKIVAPNRGYTGISAGVSFASGRGETDDPRLIKWFKDKGYEVVDEAVEVNETEVVDVVELTDMALEDLKTMAKNMGIQGISRLKKDDLIQIIKENEVK